VYRDAFFEDGVHVAGAAGISADKGIKLGGGITFPDSTHQTTAVNPTAVVHVAGISSDGGITAGNISINNVTNEITMPTGGRIKSPGSHNIYFPTTGIQIQAAGSSNNSFEVVTGRAIVNSSLLLHIKGSGISMDQGGITFADGTYQDTAASGSGGATGAAGSAGTSVGYTAGNTAPVSSPTGDFWFRNDTGSYYANVFDGSTLGWLQISGIQGVTGNTGPQGTTGSGDGGVSAGAGMTLAGSTLGIDPTATIHVAGISADGGITASSVHSTGLLSGDNGINLSAGDITVANGARFTSGVNGTIRVASGEVQLLPGNDTSKGLLLGTTIHTHKKITVFEEGISMDAAGITFADGTYQDTAASGSTITAGAGMTLAGSTLGIDPTAVVHVAGISSDGGATFGGDILMGTNLTSTVGNGNIQFSGAAGSSILLRPQGNTSLTVSTTAVTIPSNRGFVAGNVSTLSGLVTASSGITLGSGITFPDGTYQDTAATGSTITAGAGMTLAGSTLGIDPTAVVHVAGISSDGGATFGGNVIIPDGGLITDRVVDPSNTNSRFGYVAGNSSFVVYTGNNDVRMSVNSQGIQTSTSGGQSGRIYAAGYLESGGVVKAGTGVSLDAGGITFADGTYQASAASGSGGGTASTDWKWDPESTTYIRIFDDFLASSMGDAVDNNAGAATQFLQLGSNGGYWKSWVNQIEDTGFDLRGFVYADNGTNTSASSCANIAQLLSNSPTDGDEVMVEFKVKFDIDKATAGNTVFWLSAYRSDNVATANTTEASSGYSDTAKAGICARALSTNFEGYVYDNAGTNGTPTFTDAGVASADDTFYRIGLHYAYESAGTKYVCKAFINGTQVYTADITTGTGSPYIQMGVYNYGKAYNSNILIDYGVLQYTAPTITWKNITSV
jgi:hypothetical protein